MIIHRRKTGKQTKLTDVEKAAIRWWNDISVTKQIASMVDAHEDFKIVSLDD